SGEQTSFECVLNERFEEPGALYVNLQVPGDDTTFDSLTATMLRSPDGEYVPIVQSWSTEEYDWRDQFTAEELEIVERIEAAGYDGGALEIVGYDGASPVWLSWGTNGPCVIAVGDSGVAEACADDHASD